MGERGYLSLVKEAIETGAKQANRTGVATRALFGRSVRYDLSAGFPLLTTRPIFFRGVAEEYLWIARGETNAATLSAKGIKIWDGNSSRAFLDSRGLTHYDVGELGPVYGFQWRHFGASYPLVKDAPKGVGVDQLKEVIRLIKTEPDSRRILLSAWNPCQLSQMALPPCHVLAQFRVSSGRLSCAMYQRSCDLGLGAPFNIASYSLMTFLLAHHCGLKVGEFVHFIGDAHVYETHVDGLKQQIKREPRPLPKLLIHALPSVPPDQIEYNHLSLNDYNPWPQIRLPMVV